MSAAKERETMNLATLALVAILHAESSNFQENIRQYNCLHLNLVHHVIISLHYTSTTVCREVGR